MRKVKAPFVSDLPKRVVALRTNNIKTPVIGGISEAIKDAATVGDIRRIINGLTDDAVIVLREELPCGGVYVYAPLSVNDICGTWE